MRKWTSLSAVAVALALVSTASLTAAQKPQAPKQQKKPNVTILATGGTIAGAGTGGGSYTAGQFNVEELIQAVPGLDKLANLRGEQVANIGSQDMNDAVWLKLAKRTNELLARKDVDAIVITHGTDTMEETAYFLDLVVKSPKPVVLVGSMRPATAVSADGPGNLHDAVAAAVSPGARGRGVLVAMNDTIHNARDITKTNTSSVETFVSPDRGPAGVVTEGDQITWFEPSNKRHTTKSEFSVDRLNSLPRVDIIYAHANMDGSLIQDAVKNGARGIVIAGVGNGNMSKAALDAITKAVRDGIIVVRSTGLPTGIVSRNAEVNDDEIGTVASGELNPRKSRVLLQLALTEPRHSPTDVQRIFAQY